MTDRHTLNKMFQGYQLSSQLWQGNDIWNLEQLPIDLNTQCTFTSFKNGKNLRLGKWVEEFVLFQLNTLENVEVLGSGIQIKKDKLTIGELDSLFLLEGMPIHLEIVYKYYLYDPDIREDSSLANWIGPNRNDRLLQKLNKLKSRQLHLLQNEATKNILESLDIFHKTIKQNVLFKAKLFIPYNSKFEINSALNPSCVVGEYLRLNQLINFEAYSFFIPSKLEWLLVPNIDVHWLNYEAAKSLIRKELDSKRSPLIWVKDNKNKIRLIFVVWW